MSKTLCLTVLTCLVAAPAVAGEPIDFCVSIQTSSVNAGPVGGSVDTFSVRTTEDLEFLALFLEPIKGNHILELKMRTPRGHHYQTFTVPIATDASERGTQRRVPTYPRPLDVHVLEEYESRDGRVQGTTLRMPVAGTSVVSGSLYGKWHIDVYLDGQEMPCQIENSFSLTE